MQPPSFPLPSIKIPKDEREGLFTVLCGLEGALPNYDEVPSVLRPRLLVLGVSADVAPELRIPERTVGLRLRGGRAKRRLDELVPVPLPPVLMPEAAPNLDKRATLRNHDVGMTDDAPVADAKAVAVRPEHLSYDDFRQRVARMYRRHDLRSLLPTHRVHAVIIP